MASVNKVILIGNLGADPEARYLESGSVVTKFNIATTETYTNKNGERVDNTEWHRIELWEGLAKVAEKYLKKGNQVYIEGRIRTDEWTDNEGATRRGTTIRGNSMTLLGGSGNPKLPEGGLTEDRNSDGTQRTKLNDQTQKKNDPIPPSLLSSDDDDDLPF